MTIPTKLKKIFGKCKKLSCITKITKNKKESKESIKSSTVTITNTITKVNNDATTLSEKQLLVILPKEKELVRLDKKSPPPPPPQPQQRQQLVLPKERQSTQLDTKPHQQQQQNQQNQQQHQQQQQQQEQEQHYHHHQHSSFGKRSSINNIFNKSKLIHPSSYVHQVPIKLNVGGIIYMTTQQTLCTYPSYLSELFFIFRSPNSPPTSTYSQYPWPEELFIDRDGELFIHILTFLRNGTLPYSTPLSILQKLEYEAKFYGIKPLQTLIYQRIQIHSSSPKFKVIPIERLSDEECDLEDDDEFTTSPRICLKRSNLSYCSTTSSYDIPQQQDDASIYSCSSSGDSSEEVPIIYNPGNTTSNTCSTVTPTTCYTRTPKSSISTSNFTIHKNLYLSSVSAQHYDYKPDYEIISITNAPTINDLESLDQFHVPDEELYAKDLATFAVLQRKDK